MKFASPSKNIKISTNVNPEILLHPNIPKPLHGVSPRTLFGQAWWDEIRQKVYAERDYHCWACGVHKSNAKYHQWLEAHECYYYDYKKGTLTLKEIVALCHFCHSYIHSGLQEILLKQGKITFEKHQDIRAHGRTILAKAEISQSDTPFVARNWHSSQSPDWGDWKMIIAGKRYSTKFKSYDEWYRFYNK